MSHRCSFSFLPCIVGQDPHLGGGPHSHSRQRQPVRTTSVPLQVRLPTLLCPTLLCLPNATLPYTLPIRITLARLFVLSLLIDASLGIIIAIFLIYIHLPSSSLPFAGLASSVLAECRTMTAASWSSRKPSARSTRVSQLRMSIDFILFLQQCVVM